MKPEYFTAGITRATAISQGFAESPFTERGAAAAALDANLRCLPLKVTNLVSALADVPGLRNQLDL